MTPLIFVAFCFIFIAESSCTNSLRGPAERLIDMHINEDKSITQQLFLSKSMHKGGGDTKSQLSPPKMKTIEHKTTKQNRYKTLFQDFDNVINDSNINGNNNNEKEKKSVVNNSNNNIDNNTDESEVMKEKILYGPFALSLEVLILQNR